MLLQSCCKNNYKTYALIHCRAVGGAPEHHRMSKYIAVLFVDLDQQRVFYSMEVKIATVCSWLAAYVFTAWRSKLPLSAFGSSQIPVLAFLMYFTLYSFFYTPLAIFIDTW